ncbi:MAG: right-handed parallel beta-helix repeat-containing protein [Planctomycetes bacterium]|nr:right-handed parallel beta-helix repeat-containing protein [Planctomycetota bacterium]
MLKSLRLEDTQSQGVFIGSSTYVTVRQCALKNTGEDGILVTSSTGVLIDKCSITAPGGDGINLHDCDGCVVQKNKIKNASMEGIEADGDMHTFEANTIDGTGEAGIQVGDGATGCRNALVLGNKITGAGTVGILCFADAQDCSILENSVINSVVQGVIAEAGSDGHVISKNTVRETGDYGVFIDSDFCALLQNTVTESAEDGIRIALGCSGALVSKNTVTKASMSGFSVVGTGNVFVQNKASKSQDYDLDDQTGPEQNIFINNSFSTVAPP